MKKYLLLFCCLVLSYLAYNQTIYTETFESAWTVPTTLSPAWSGTTTPANNVWQKSTYTTGWSSSSGSFSPTGANSTTGAARFHTYDASSGTSGELISPTINLSAYTAGQVKLDFYHINTSGTDALNVYVSNDDGATWSTALAPSPIGVSAAWTLKTITLPGNSATTKIKFTATSDYGTTDIGIDEFRLYQPVSANAAPVNFVASVITTTSMTVSWDDASTNETAFRVYRSLDNVNFTKIGTDIASTTSAGTGTTYSSVQSGLAPGFTYYFRVVATADLESPYLLGNATTTAPNTYTASASGNWSAPATWSPSPVPTATDNVVIPTGITVTVDATTNTCYSLTIDDGGTVNVGSGTTYKLSVNHNLVNNGTLDLYSSATVYADLTFLGGYNSSFTGTGATTDLSSITVNKGSGAITAFSPVIEIMPANLTIKGSNNSTAATGGFLNTGTFNGIVKFSGSYTLTNTIFITTGYSIPSTAGFWLNNANFTVAALNGSPTMSGLFRLTAGTFNLGTAAGNSMGFSTGSIINIEGGSVIAASRFGVGSASNTINYSQSGGNITVNAVGNTSTTLAAFDLGTSATSTISLTGGTITVKLASTSTSGPRDFRGASTSVIYPAYTGTTLYLGDATNAAIQTYYLSGSLPPMVIATTPYTHKIALAASAYYYGDLSLPSTSDLNLNGYGLWVKGNIVNNGTVTGTTTGSRLDFANALFSGTSAQTYSGAGTFGTASTPVLSVGVNNANASGVTLSAPINTLRVNLFTGTLNGSGQVSIGNGTSGSAVVQIGVGLTAAGGSFDTYPVMNLGATGTYTILYSTESGARTTGFEIPVTRTVTNVSVNNTFGVNLAGGDLTIGATAVSGLLTLTSGVLKTSGATIFLPYTGTSISGGSATAYVDGKLVRSFPASRTASGTYSVATMFPIGKGASYLPIYVDPTTNAGGAVTISAEAFTTNSGSFGGGVTSMSNNRWEALITAGNSNLTNSFLRIGDAAIVTGKQILQASTAAGAYGAIPSSSVFTAGTPNVLTTGTSIPAAGYLGYFTYGDLTSCAVPTAQPTILATNFLTSTGFDGSFTAAAPAPSNYLVVRYPSAAVVTPPVDYTAYTVGAALGLGTVRSISGATTFVESGLTAATTYDYYVYSYNNSGCYGPVYLAAAPLYKNVTTCAAAVGTPGTPTVATPSTSGFTLNWTASSTVGVDYLLDVATDAAFTSFVPGFNGLVVGVGVLTANVTGLSAGTPYFARVRAFEATLCYSSYSSTITAWTLCNVETAPTVAQDFSTYAGSAPYPVCWSEATGTLATSSTLTYGSSEWNSSTGFANAGTNKGAKVNLYSTGNDWLISQAIDLGATPGLYSVQFNMAVTSYNGTVAQPTLGTHVVKIVVSTDGGATWSDANVIKTYTGAGTYSNVGQTEVVALTGYTGVIKVAFYESTTSSTPDIDFHIDDFQIVPTPLATVITTVATSITGSTALSGGTASGAAITARGVCWGTSSNPTIAGPHTTDGSGTGTFISSISGLSPNTPYYYRAYVTNIAGTAYGNELTFTTIDAYAPTVTMGAMSSIATITATAAGTVVNDGGSGPILANGFVYSTTPNPVVGGVGVTQVSVVAPAVGPYTYDLTGLAQGTLYYINAFATNSVGVGYGTETSFSTFAPPAVTTTAISAITQNSAISGGTVTADFGSAVTARGICYATTANPDLTSTVITDGAGGLGAFVSNMISLSGNQLYHVRAYATNGYGTSYGADLTFTTLCGVAALPYTQDFESAVVPGLPSCTSIQNAGSGNNWATASAPGNGFTTKALRYAYNGTYDANAWFFTQAVTLNGGTSYRITYNYGNNSTFYTENLKVCYGTSADYTSMTNVIADHFAIIGGTIQNGIYDFTPLTTGTYYFGFNCYSDADMYNLYVDNIVVDITPLCPPPSALASVPSNFSAAISWTPGGTEGSWDVEWAATPYTFTGTPTLNVLSPGTTLSPLTASTGYTYQVRANCAGSSSAWVGPHTFTTLVACPPPTTLSVSGITTNSAKLAWNEAGTATAWDIELIVAGGTFTGTPTVAGTMDNPYTYGSLVSGTSYSFKVRSSCSVSEQSTWAGPFTFATLCDAQTVPYGIVTFEGTTFPPTPCWSRYSGLLAAPSTLTASTGGWIQDDFRNVTSPVDKAAKVNIYGTTVNYWLMTPQIDLGAGSATLRLEFDLALNTWNTSTAPGAAPDDKFVVVISTDGGTTWTSANTLREWNNTGSTYVYDNINYTTGEHVIIPLAGYSGTVMFGFYGESTVSNGDNDLMINNLVVQEPPTCDVPTGLTASATSATSASIAWSGAGTIDLDFGPVGHTAGTGTVQTGITANPYNLNVLNANTAYHIYIRQNCGASTSLWIGPVAVTTPCNAVSAPLYEPFATTTQPSCWTISGPSNWLFTTSWPGYGAAGVADHTPGGGGSFAGVDGSSPYPLTGITLSSPLIDVTSLSNGRVRFYMFNNNTSSATIADEQRLSVDLWDGAAWNVGAFVWDFGQNAAGWQEQGFNLSAYTITGPIQVRFVVDKGSGLPFYDDIMIDDFSVYSLLAHDVSTVSVDMAALTGTGVITPMATVKNEGTNAETFNVTMTIDTYTSTQPVISLAPGASLQVSFDPWTATAGNFTVNVCTSLTTPVADQDASNDCKTKAVAIEVLTKFYIYNAFTNQVGYIYKEHPGTFVSLATATSVDGIYAGTWADGVWYGSEYYDATTGIGGGWYTIDPNTGAMTLLNNLALGFSGVTYDHTTNKMYGLEYDDVNLTNKVYQIDPPTGNTTLLGTVGAGDLFINLATDGSGFLYSIGIGVDHLFKFDPLTLVTTDLGAIGFDFNYAQDMEYDYASNTMYAAGYNNTTSVGGLYTVNTTTGAATFVSAFAGNAEMTGFAIPYVSTKTLNVNIFLEGLYNATTGQMTEALDISPNPQWGVGIADKVTIELHDGTAPYATAYTFADVDLLIDGSVVIPDVPGSIAGSYYVVVRHRNSIETWSATAISFAGAGPVSYDFTIDATQAFGDNMKLMGTAYVIFGGDASQDGSVDGTDMALIDNASTALLFGYYPEDCNGDGGVDGTDMAIIDNNSTSLVQVVKP